MATTTTTEPGDDGKKRKRRNIITIAKDFQIDESDYNVVLPIFQQFVKDFNAVLSDHSRHRQNNTNNNNNNNDDDDDPPLRDTAPDDIRMMIDVSQKDPERRVNFLALPGSVRTPPKSILRLDVLEELKIVPSRTEFPKWLATALATNSTTNSSSKSSLSLSTLWKLQINCREIFHWSDLECSEGYIGGGYVPFPTAICAGGFTDLQELELSIDHVPEEIRALVNLEILIAHDDTLSLPKSIGKLSRLHRLSLRGCENLKELPDEIGNLGSLASLDLSRCSGLRYLPRSIGNLRSLKRLCLSHTTQLKELPDEIGTLGGSSSGSNLTRLDLSGCGVALAQNLGCKGSLPDSISNLAHLSYLNLSGLDMLRGLPESFGNLTNLRELDLSGTGIASLPASFGNLTNLTIVPAAAAATTTTTSTTTTTPAEPLV